MTPRDTLKGRWFGIGFGFQTSDFWGLEFGRRANEGGGNGKMTRYPPGLYISLDALHA